MWATKSVLSETTPLHCTHNTNMGSYLKSCAIQFTCVLSTDELMLLAIYVHWNLKFRRNLGARSWFPKTKTSSTSSMVPYLRNTLEGFICKKQQYFGVNFHVFERCCIKRMTCFRIWSTACHLSHFITGGNVSVLLIQIKRFMTARMSWIITYAFFFLIHCNTSTSPYRGPISS